MLRIPIIFKKASKFFPKKYIPHLIYIYYTLSTNIKINIKKLYHFQKEESKSRFTYPHFFFPFCSYHPSIKIKILPKKGPI